MRSTAWLMRFVPRPAAAARLFCFSYAGGGAAVYRPFAAGLPSVIDVCAVQLPGRESRLREAPLGSIATIVEAVTTQLAPFLDRPFAFFGHSMGGLVAYEVARALAAQRRDGPAHLLVSARRAPHLADTDAPISNLPDDAFVAEIGRRYGGIPAEVLQHRDLLELLLPALRADMGAIEAYRHAAGPRLDCPITVFGGRDDERARREVLAPWREHTAAASCVHQFDGGHFYFNDAAVRSRLLAEVSRLLLPLTAHPAQPPAQAPEAAHPLPIQAA